MYTGRRSRERRNRHDGDSDTLSYGATSRDYSYMMEYEFFRYYFMHYFGYDIFAPEDMDEEEDEVEEEEEVAPPEVIEKELTVKEVELHIAENTFLHKTNRFYDTKKEAPKRRLVVRRGQAFKMTITFNQIYDPAKYDLDLVFKTGKDSHPSLSNPGNGTYIDIQVDESGATFDSKKKWHARLVDKKDTSIVLEILPSCNTIIGQWDFHIYTRKNGAEENTKTLRYDAPDEHDIIILFNPWCKDDTVYFEEDPLNKTEVHPLDEYMMNDVGVVFVGSEYRISARHWRFGQFDKDVLRIALAVLKLGTKGIVDSSFANPITIARIISQNVNACDYDNGVLVGRWDGKYEDGVRPTQWGGSPSILRKYEENKYKPVKYGQCWVFSAVTTTVCRALGLPCRSVTNFMSAHDTDGSNTIDRFFDGKEYTGADSVCAMSPKKLDNMRGKGFFPIAAHVKFQNQEVFCGRGQYRLGPVVISSCDSGILCCLKKCNPQVRQDIENRWNFHVWNEVFMQRPDLSNADGWQAIDATPQETSWGLYRLGPCPVRSVKLGQVTVPYDTAFVFSEVNADRITWEKKGGKYLCQMVEKSVVGMSISTKPADGKAFEEEEREDGRTPNYAFDYKKRLDITSNYKFKQGSAEERLAVHNAQQLGSNPENRVFKDFKDVELKVEVKPEDIEVGQNFEVILKLKNITGSSGQNSSKLEIVSILTRVENHTYSGGRLNRIKKFKEGGFSLLPNEEKKISYEVSVDDYANKIGERIYFRAYAMLGYKKGYGKRTTFGSVEFELGEPQVTIKVPKKCRVNEEVSVKLFFKNPLPVKLKNCTIELETEKFPDHKETEIRDVEPYADWSKTFKIKAHTEGRGHISAVFDSDQLSAINGYHGIDILP